MYRANRASSQRSETTRIGSLGQDAEEDYVYFATDDAVEERDDRVRDELRGTSRLGVTASGPASSRRPDGPSDHQLHTISYLTHQKDIWKSRAGFYKRWLRLSVVFQILTLIVLLVLAVYLFFYQHVAVVPSGAFVTDFGPDFINFRLSISVHNPNHRADMLSTVVASAILRGPGPFSLTPVSYELAAQAPVLLNRILPSRSTTHLDLVLPVSIATDPARVDLTGSPIALLCSGQRARFVSFTLIGSAFIDGFVSPYDFDVTAQLFDSSAVDASAMCANGLFNVTRA